MKFIKSAIFVSLNLFAMTMFASDTTNKTSEIRCYIEYPKDAGKSNQWRNYYGDAVIQATSDERFIYPSNKDNYQEWGGKLDRHDFIELPEGTQPQKFETRDAYKAYLLAHCANNKQVVAAKEYVPGATKDETFKFDFKKMADKAVSDFNLQDDDWA